MIDVTIATTPEEIERLRKAWSALQGEAVTADIDYHLALVRHGPRVQRPHVLLFRQGGRPIGLAVARIDSIELASKLGYKTVYRPRVRALTVVYDGLLGAAADELAPRVVSELFGSLRRGEADVLLLPNLRMDGRAFAEATTQPPFLCRQHVFDPKVHRRRRLPRSFEEFLGSLSRRTREGVRRSDRRLVGAHGDKIAVKSFARPSDLEQFFADAEPVAATTYQRGLGVAIRGDELEWALSRLAAEKGWFRAWILYLAERPVAFWHGYAYGGVFRTNVPGYDPQLRELNVGSYLLMKAIEDLCADPAVEVLDFGFGDAEYKRRFADEEWEEADIALFAPTLAGVRVNVIRTGLVAANRFAKRALGSDGLGRAKRAWRNRFSGSS